jgi:uncharacterized membrane protein SirB2
MEAFYTEIRTVHVATVLVSGSLFFLRGLGVNVFGAAWPMWPAIRYLSYAIDTVLLAAALMLVIIVQQYPLIHAWLTVKVLLVGIYIVLGSFALKRGKTRAARLGFFVMALLVFGVVISIARTQNPLGIFSSLM